MELTDVKENEQTKETKESIDLVRQANEAASRLETANKQMAELLLRQERLKVEEIIGGTAKAGKQEKTQAQRDIEDAKAMLTGTGFEDMQLE